MNNLEKKKADCLKNYLKNKAHIYLDRKINHDKYIAYWRNYSKENREHRRVLEKQSRLRFKQTKKYLIPKLIRTLKKIRNIKKTQEIVIRKMREDLLKQRKKILRNLISVLKKIKRKKSYKGSRKDRHFKRLQKKKEVFLYKKNLQSQMKRPLKKVLGVFEQKLRLTYGNTQKLHEYLLWYISTPKVCGYCGISEELLVTKLWFNKKSPYLEIDRKDPNNNYEFHNIHLACSVCNSTKLHIFSYEEMKQIGPKFILPKWNNPYTSKINKNLKIIHYPTSLKNSIEFPKEYPIWIKLKKRSRRIGKKLFYLSFEEFLSWYEVQKSNCIYCDISEELLNLPKIKPIFSWCSDRLTIDRISPVEGYLSKNIALSCLACNTIKSNVFTFEEMKKIGLILRKKWQNLLKGGSNV